MNKLKLGILSLISVFTLVGAMQVFQGDAAYAASCSTPVSCIQNGTNSAGGSSDKTTLGTRIKTIVNMILYILGAIAVIMIVIGGVKYTTSNGDSSAISSAKNTILYAVVGLVVAILAYAIVNFVLDSFAK
jgi:putative exporter of polyketide antibiotics